MYTPQAKKRGNLRLIGKRGNGDVFKRKILVSIFCITLLIVGAIVPAGAASGTSVDIPVSYKNMGSSDAGTVYITLKPKTIKGDDGTLSPMPEGSSDNLATIKINGDGRAAFENIVFDGDGIYRYEVAQKAGTNTEISYDKTVYEVKVIVKDGKSHLTIHKKNAKVKEDASEVEFENADKRPDTRANSVNIAPPVKKKIDGKGTYTNDTFNFTMTPTDDTKDLLGSEETYKAKIKGAGTVKFPRLMMDTPGTYVFTIRESQDHTFSWNYDETEYKYTVVVAEKDGDLVIESTKIETDGKTVKSMTYTNSPSISNRIYSDIKTGDPQQWMLLIVMVVAGLLVITFIVAPKKRRKND